MVDITNIDFYKLDLKSMIGYCDHPEVIYLLRRDPPIVLPVISAASYITEDINITLRGEMF